MTKKQTIRLALDVLEKEMAVLSHAEIMNVFGGSGSPLPSGYCTFNDIAFNLQQMGQDVSSANVLGNYTGQYGTGDFSFDTNGVVTGVSTANGSNANAFKESIFNMNTIDNGNIGIAQAIANGNLVSLSSSAANGHAYTVTSYDESNHSFTVRDTTLNQNVTVPDGQMGNLFVNPKEITGIKSGVFGSSGSWTSTEQSSVASPSTGGSSTGH